MKNVIHKFQGKTDIPLNSLGRHQASEVILSGNYDMTYHSGLKRSKETLDIMSDDNSVEESENGMKQYQ